VYEIIDDLTAQLLDSFSKVGGINHIDGCNLPSKNAVADITQRLLHLMFPGFYDNEALHHHNVKLTISRQLAELSILLMTELRKSFEFSTSNAETDAETQAERVVRDFLSTLPKVRMALSKDVQAAFEGDPAAKSFEEIILAYPGIEAIAVQRLAHELHKLGVVLIPRMMTEWAHSLTGIDIHPGASLGEYFFIDHGTGVVIGETTVIGHHVKLYQGVTLGAKSTSGGQSLRDSKRHPTIGNHVTIYSGATILGGEVAIGDYSTIGGNVFLLQSVPPYHRVLNSDGGTLIEPRNAINVHDFQI
jgi:serine O-acetyltransferase